MDSITFVELAIFYIYNLLQKMANGLSINLLHNSRFENEPHPSGVKLLSVISEILQEQLLAVISKILQEYLHIFQNTKT